MHLTDHLKWTFLPGFSICTIQRRGWYKGGVPQVPTGWLISGKGTWHACRFLNEIDRWKKKESKKIWMLPAEKAYDFGSLVSPLNLSSKHYGFKYNCCDRLCSSNFAHPLSQIWYMSIQKLICKTTASYDIITRDYKFLRVFYENFTNIDPLVTRNHRTLKGSVKDPLAIPIKIVHAYLDNKWKL